jgi:hypothetical protein
MRQSFLIGIIALAAFATGAFAVSPELRAYAAATITSADIVNSTIQSEDIKNGQVKNADLGSNAVTGGKVLNGTLGYGDLSRSFVIVEHRDDCDCGGTGWDPDGTSNTEILYDSRITPDSVVVMTGIYGPTNYSTLIEDPEWGSVKIYFAAPAPDGFEINYAIFNMG